MADFPKYTDDLWDLQLAERLVAGYPDAGQLIAIISRSYEYIQTLPLRGLTENYSRYNPELFDIAM